MMNIDKWLAWVQEVGVTQTTDALMACDVCEKENLTNKWLNHKWLNAYGRQGIPRVCLKHGQELNLLW